MVRLPRPVRLAVPLTVRLLRSNRVADVVHHQVAQVVQGSSAGHGQTTQIDQRTGGANGHDALIGQVDTHAKGQITLV